jgi:hypothetical protein
MKKKQRKPNAEYTLPSITLKKSTRVIIGIDPGSRNMGISAVALNDKNNVRCVANAIVTNPIYDLTTFNMQRQMFLSEIDRWYELFNPVAFVAERFQTRGIGGPLIEYVSSMLGLIGGRYNIPVKLTTAATWKNRYNRRFDLQLEDVYKMSRVTPHQLDSSLIGVYGWESGLKQDLEYDPISYMKTVEQSSLVRLINKRNKE